MKKRLALSCLLQVGLILALLTGVVSAEYRWYKGDLHMHTDHSDGGLNQLADWLPRDTNIESHVILGKARGLDYLVVSDHRTLSQYYDVLHETEELLLIPGNEWGGHPHGVMVGLNENIEQGPHAGKGNSQSANYLAHAQGALFAMSHPGDPGNSWWAPGENYFETKRMDLIEIWNSGPFLLNAEANRDAIQRWEGFLNEDQHITAIGASDVHFYQLDAVAGVGKPCTHVYAERLTESAIIKAMKAGHVYVSGDPAWPEMEFFCDADDDGHFEAMMGDSVTYVPGGEVVLNIQVRGVPFTTMRIYDDEGVVLEDPIEDSDYAKDFVLPADAKWYRVEILREILPDETASLYSSIQSPFMESLPTFPLPVEWQCLDIRHAAHGRNARAGALIEELIALTNPIYLEPSDTLPTPTPRPTRTPTPTPIDESGPRILLAGYLDSRTFSPTGPGGDLTLVAVIDESQMVASSIDVELLRNYRPLNQALRDDGTSGDFAVADGIYGISIPAADAVPGEIYGIEASPNGIGRAAYWPWLVVY